MTARNPQTAKRNRTNNPSRQKRADKAEKERRIEDIVERIAEGQGGQRLVDWIVDEYQLKESTAYEYYKQATDRINQSFKEDDLQKHKSSIVTRLNHVYTSAMKTANYAAALRALDQLAKIQGLEAPKEVRNTHNFEDLESADDAELRRIIASGTSS